jgi:hypothetical protein
MLRAYTLEQLLFANAIMFPADFERLMKKYSAGTPLEGAEFLATYDFKNKYRSNLLTFIGTISRADDWEIELLDKMIADILKLEEGDVK